MTNFQDQVGFIWSVADLLRGDYGVSKDFLFCFYTSQAQQLREQMNQGMGQPNLNTDIVQNIDVPFPPAAEQKQIAIFLDEHYHRNQNFFAPNQGQFTKLRDYRQALISAAGTGKIAALQEVAT